MRRVGGSDGADGELDGPLKYPVLCFKRRRAGFQRDSGRGDYRDRPGLYCQPFGRKIFRRKVQRKGDKVRTHNCEISGYYAAAPGRRGAGHVHNGRESGAGRDDYTKYCAFWRAGL